MRCGWPVEIDTAVQVWLCGRQRPGFGEVLVGTVSGVRLGEGLCLSSGTAMSEMEEFQGNVE